MGIGCGEARIPRQNGAQSVVQGVGKRTCLLINEPDPIQSSRSREGCMGGGRPWYNPDAGKEEERVWDQRSLLKPWGRLQNGVSNDETPKTTQGTA